MKQKVALVLSGGGARGIAHIGVIEELEKYGFEITSVAGTSMGALVGGVYAQGKLEVYRDWLCTIDKVKMFKLVDFTFRGQGLVKGDRLLNTMREMMDDANIEDLRIPYAAVAADIINKKEVVFTKGNIWEAIRASIAIPTVLTPVKTDDGLLVDGGVIDSLPMGQVKRTPGDILVAVDVNAAIHYERPPAAEPPVQQNGAIGRLAVYQEKIKELYNQLHKESPQSSEDKFGYFYVISKTLSLMTQQNTQASLKKHTPDILVNVSHECCGTYDFFKAAEIMEAGHFAAVKALDEYGISKAS